MGVNLSKEGCKQKFSNLNLSLPEFFRSRVASFESNPGRLGELGGNLLPHFPINRRRVVVPNIPNPPPPWLCISAILGEKNCFREENPSRGASVTLPRCFCKQIREGFPPLFTVLHPFFILQRVSFQIKLFDSFYVPVEVPICFVYFYSRFRLLSVPHFDVLQSFI